MEPVSVYTQSKEDDVLEHDSREMFSSLSTDIHLSLFMLLILISPKTQHMEVKFLVYCYCIMGVLGVVLFSLFKSLKLYL